MKLSKTLMILTTSLAVFGIGHVRALVAHGQFGCAVAAAQSWDSGAAADDSAAPDDSAASPDKIKTPPPDIAGGWEGELDDNALGFSDTEFDINQKGTKLSGSWDSNFGGGGFKGSINGEGVVKMNLKAGGHCRLAAVGELVTEGEIEMTYQLKTCKGFKHDHGTIDIFAVP
jgi:opacity protein-like surface antigen